MVGGAERVLLDCLFSLRRADPRLSLHLILGANGPLAEQAQETGATVTLLPLPTRLASAGDSELRGRRSWRRLLALVGRGALVGWGVISYIRRLRCLLHRLRPDLVHSNGLKMHVLAALADRGRRPLVWHIHDYLSLRPLVRRVLPLLAKYACGAIAISRSVADDIRRVLPRLPVEVILNGIDCERFRPDGPALDLDAAAGLGPAPPHTVRVGLVATYARWKGHDIFLQAAVLVRARTDLPPVRFFVVGGPVYQTAGSQFSRNELQELATGFGLEETIGFVDFQSDSAPVYRALDVVVHASTLPEPFGLTVAEAMACGRAIVVSRAGGAAELFEKGVNAVGVSPGDAEGLAGALAELVRSPALRRSLGEAAVQTAQQRFNRSRLGDELFGCYQRFLRIEYS